MSAAAPPPPPPQPPTSPLPSCFPSHRPHHRPSRKGLLVSRRRRGCAFPPPSGLRPSGPIEEAARRARGPMATGELSLGRPPAYRLSRRQLTVCAGLPAGSQRGRSPPGGPRSRGLTCGEPLPPPVDRLANRVPFHGRRGGASLTRQQSENRTSKSCVSSPPPSRRLGLAPRAAAGARARRQPCLLAGGCQGDAVAAPPPCRMRARRAPSPPQRAAARRFGRASGGTTASRTRGAATAGVLPRTPWAEAPAHLRRPPLGYGHGRRSCGAVWRPLFL